MIHNQQQIISGLINGDTEIFKEVYHFYVNKLERFVLGYIHNKEETYDIVQNVFIILWEKRKTLEVNSNLLNYLITLAKNQSLNYIKHLKVQANYQGQNERLWKEMMLSAYALEKLHTDPLILEELDTVIKQSIDSLPGQCREIFMMSRFYSMKYNDIAQELNISVKTVEKKMSVSLQILRLALKDYLPVFLFCL